MKKDLAEREEQLHGAQRRSSLAIGVWVFSTVFINDTKNGTDDHPPEISEMNPHMKLDNMCDGNSD